MEKIKKIKKFLKKNIKYSLIDITWEEDGLKVKIILIFFLY
jgi:hypothetical protein